MSDDAPARGTGPMLLMLIGFAVLCAGSVGGVGFVVWRVVQNRAELAAGTGLSRPGRSRHPALKRLLDMGQQDSNL